MTATTEPQVADATLDELRTRMRGSVLGPESAGYDDARAVWNGMHDLRPAAIARCTGVADVIAALAFARSHGLDLAVRGGGHSFAGFSTCEGGLVIDLGPMRGVRVDPVARTAVAQPGLRWGDLDHETQAFGLAVTGGLVSTTGIAGFTLGGGVGWLVRRYGMTVDSLLSCDVVTADGTLVHASAGENSDLFWGLRGGGGNFGIVTAFEYRLHPVGPMVTGGAVFIDGARAAETLRWLRDWVETVPEEVTTLVNLTSAPPLPFLPEEWHGRPIVGIAAMHCGELDAGARALQPLKERPGIVADLIGPIPYVAQQGLFDPLLGPGDHWYAKAGFVQTLSNTAIDAIVGAHASRATPVSEVHVHHIGGAMARGGAEETAVGERGAPWLVNLMGRCSDAGEDAAVSSWARAAYEALSPQTTGSAYMNFLSAEGDERYRAAFGSKYERLLALKRAWDPENVFRLNQNIVP